MIIGALLVLLIIRQIEGQYMDQRRLRDVPMILGVVGVIYLPLTVTAIVPADAVPVLLGLVLAVGVGLGLGALSMTQQAVTPDRRGRRIIVRSGWKGGALWVAFTLGRVILQPIASIMHATLVTSAGVAIILVAITRAVMAAVVAPRVRAAQAALASRKVN